jgi:ribosomal protein L7/L12
MAEEIELTEGEIAEIQKQRIIPAIKMLRERTGCGLIQAKEAVERTGARLEMFTEGVCPTCHGTGKARRWK